MDPAEVEAKTQSLGRQLWSQLARRRPSIFERRWWDDRILYWAMSDESVKVQMFRFVDVLPMLRTHEAITRHLQEYFEEVREHVPGAARLILEHSQPNTVLGRALALNARSNARRMAERFIAGSSVEEVFQAILRMRRQGFAFTLDVLGEAVLSEREADAYQQTYLDLIGALAPRLNDCPEIVPIDRDHVGPIPRVNVSLKLSALDSQFRPVDAKGAAERVKSRLRPILRAACEHGAHVHIDMEHYSYKDLTLAIFREVLMEDEFRDFPDVGIVIQTYLPDAEADLRELLKWAKRRGTPVWVRLVKGAYWDYETVIARLRGWPVPVFRLKWQTDENFERQTRFLMENYRWLRPAFGSHNLRSVAHALAWAEKLRVPRAAYEIQMLYGMATEQAQLLAEAGYRVRIYTPFGQLIPGMAYLVRRLLENTSNDSFLRHSVTEDIPMEELMMKPADVGAQSPPVPEDKPKGFRNEPHTDFSQPAAREAMQQALETVAESLGQEYPLVIEGRVVETRETLVSRNPSHARQIVGRVASASPEDAERAIVAARNAFPSWARTEPAYRAEYLELVAREMRNRRFELAAWEVFECGKPWAEADADVAEAIDFCMYYAQEMRRLAEPRRNNLPGEDNCYSYRPRGVAVVIAPWNFPLAILTGMTVAALVTGNTVVMKPAEQSSVVAAQLMSIFQEVGLPDGVVNFLPGEGEVVGPALVGSPDIDLVAFTGSREVGLEINEAAARTDPRQRSVKRVIAEMGGKNAILIDDDADLDEAVQGVIQSAFGYSGQKCSACSRVIVHKTVYDTFLKRLVDATDSLPIGPAEDPGTLIGPVIDEAAREKILEYIEIGQTEATLAFAADPGDWADEGYYVGPHIFVDVPPHARIAQEEIFGPVLCVIKAKDLDEAIAIANDTPFALTGGIYSRSPAHLKRARQELEVGNLYLNRVITGALVDRQPFGGFKMSGIGSKAGGPDYLLQFLIPISITENTLRRGFAPQTERDETGPD
ncbi:MAG: L-glutamate gamma-semialdehyde dehydrogenase [Planctomycetes bacterium]|nr:L-glutamate gamma-semialdehyde dehydrogenase [Planctomycetota bacterium]